MEVVAAIGTFRTTYDIIKAIFVLQERVVKHKEQVEDLKKDVVELEKTLKNLEQRSPEPSDIAYSLGELSKLLEESKHLLEKLTRFRSYLRRTYASSHIRDLRERIASVKLKMVFDEVFLQEQHMRHSYLPSAPPQGSSVPAPSDARHPARRSESPLFLTPRTPSYYPADHAGIGWKAYRDRIYPGHPEAVVGRKPDCNASPQFLSPYPTQGTSIWLWKDYQKQCRSQFPGLE